MTIEFYKKLLPSKGKYCICNKDPGDNTRMIQQFVENLDELQSKLEELSKRKTDIYFAMASFNGTSRAKNYVSYNKSFYVDLDVGDGKGYATKEDAAVALKNFVEHMSLPVPTIVDSGGGLHAYWIMDTEIAPDEWKLYAERFKAKCLDEGLNIDPVVTADISRILRSPDTFNYKKEQPRPTKLLTPVIEHSYAEFKELLGEGEMSLQDIIKMAPKGLSDEDRKIANKYGNYERKFQDILIKSVSGEGCNQIKYIWENRDKLPEPLWYAGLSIAQHCTDRDIAIHKLSDLDPRYNKEATESKASQAQDKPHPCSSFEENNPGGCDGCPFKGKVANPLGVIKPALAIAQGEDGEESISRELVVQEEGKEPVLKTTLNYLPKDMSPFVRGKEGGVYKINPIEDEDNPPPPSLVYQYDFYALKLIKSSMDGYCLLMRVCHPQDGDTDFYLPLSHVYMRDKFKTILSTNGVLYRSTAQENLLMSYVIEWGNHLQAKAPAETMRNQMGWTPNRESFVIGEKEYVRDGHTIDSPTSPLCRGIAKHLTPAGTFELWQDSANKLNRESLELHAFTLLAGLGSTLMNYTSTSGVTICLTGESGAAKTGALYSALSLWGNPKDLSVLNATENGMVGRFLGLHNIPFGLDEVGNIFPKTLSQLIHNVSQGKSKIRMQASINAEREHEMAASLVAIFTSNHSLYDKLSSLKKDPNGEVARLIEFAVRKPQLFKDDATMGREIFDKFRHNYGWAGPKFIEGIYKVGDVKIMERLDHWCLRFQEDFGQDTAYRFYENLVAVSMVAGEIANDEDIVSYDLDRIYRVIVGEMVAIRDNVVKVNKVDYESILGDFIFNNANNTLAFSDDKIISEPRGPLVIRVENDENTMWISKSIYDEYLISINISTKEFLYQMKQLGINVAVGSKAKKRMNAGWKDIGKSAISTYKIDLTTMPDELIKGVEQVAASA